MPLEKQVCSLELAKKLKELGYPQESLYIWVDNEGEPKVYFDDGYRPAYTNLFYCSAPTVAELGEMLSTKENNNRIRDAFAINQWVCDYETHRTLGNTEADARASMLVYLLENKLITI